MKVQCELFVDKAGALKIQFSSLRQDIADFLEDVDFEVVDRDFYMGKANTYAVTLKCIPRRPMTVRFNEDKSEAYIEYAESDPPVQATVTPTIEGDYWNRKGQWY